MAEKKKCNRAPVPMYLDRYPAKMVSRLAHKLVNRFTSPGSIVFDPFCGSGAILEAAANSGIRAIGMDVNPYACLLSRVKMERFDIQVVMRLWDEFKAASKGEVRLPIEWPMKTYWFESNCIEELERCRAAAKALGLSRSREGRAILLALALSVRRSSKADQRSPKPYISRSAKKRKQGADVVVVEEAAKILERLCDMYAGSRSPGCRVVCADNRKQGSYRGLGKLASHIITSPPYINAQDYYRSTKLELFALEGLLSFSVDRVRETCIGTERGDLLSEIRPGDLSNNHELTRMLGRIEGVNGKAAQVVHRYLADMRRTFARLKGVLCDEGQLVLVCGDNIVAGVRFPTWRVLDAMLVSMGLTRIDRFGDRIERRSVPPNRLGHRSLIKREVVTAYRFKSQV